MQGNRSRDTKPELAVRRAAHALGLRYRVSARPLPGSRMTADLVFRQAKVAVFVDGCFWHGCPLHFKLPTTNEGYWHKKIEGNRLRDLAAVENLERNGWVACRFWAHEDPLAVARVILAKVKGSDK